MVLPDGGHNSGHIHSPALLPWDGVALLSWNLSLHRSALLAGNGGALLGGNAFTLAPRDLLALLAGGAIAGTNCKESLKVFNQQPTCTAVWEPADIAVLELVGTVALELVHTAVAELAGIVVAAPQNIAVVAPSGTAVLIPARKPFSTHGCLKF